jgi:16S rRNA (cytidine1402-2'-O)-methyltransferase
VLYLVPTPLGNLEDITLRALRVLKGADLILCEDTRRTRQLLSHYGIHAPTERYVEHRPRLVGRILELLAQGKSVALVSDSGTPLLSDPGLSLVSEARRRGLPVTSLPGPSAVAAAAAGSGLPADSFVFLGFLPRSTGKRRRILQEAAGLGRTLVLYESPFRVLDLLEDARQVLGDSARAAVSRELSKVHEEWLTGTLAEVAAALASRKDLLGEFVVLIHPGTGEPHEAPADPPA